MNAPGGIQRRFVTGWASGAGPNSTQRQTLPEFNRLFNCLKGALRQRLRGPRPAAARDGAEPQRRAAAASALGAARRSRTGLKMAAAAAGGCRVSVGSGWRALPSAGAGPGSVGPPPRRGTAVGVSGSPGRAAPLLSRRPLRRGPARRGAGLGRRGRSYLSGGSSEGCPERRAASGLIPPSSSSPALPVPLRGFPPSGSGPSAFSFPFTGLAHATDLR